MCIGDNGDDLAEHPGFVGHGTTPYEPLVHVPFVVRPPGDASGQRVTEVISLVDLYPTLVSALDIDADIDPEDDIQGEDLNGVMTGSDTPLADRTVYVEGRTRSAGTTYHVARTDRWKLIEVGTGGDGGADDSRSFLGLARAAVSRKKLFISPVTRSTISDVTSAPRTTCCLTSGWILGRNRICLTRR